MASVAAQTKSALAQHNGAALQQSYEQKYFFHAEIAGRLAGICSVGRVVLV